MSCRSRRGGDRKASARPEGSRSVAAWTARLQARRAAKVERLGGYAHLNTAESFFSILKRGITGTYHSVSEAHLHRYLAEFDFRYNNRTALCVEDAERAAKTLKGTEGKRLMYNQARRTQDD